MNESDRPSQQPADRASERLIAAKRIYLAARVLALSERDDFIDRECAADDSLRALVHELLVGDDLPLPFESLAENIRAAASPTSSLAAINDLGDDRIGRYRLLQRLGEGGFGIVFAAEQTEPVKRRVALKVLKLGMDTKQVVARFEAERQALALMDHPNIAKVFDAGTTETGRPYFVMELVKGVPITEYCDARHLSIKSRLELFALVCDALQHAHQKGVIHRDIKPSNVLVSEVGDTVIPKVIDFGIAKATDAHLTDKTIFTEFRQMIGTPEYMSPEQAGVSALDIDTRTDVYSLGVLLYELLTGVTPFDSKRLRSAAYGEIQRIIREEDPPKPSTKLTKLDKLATTAQLRGTEPARLGSALRGELDCLVMKCLEKDRDLRYDSAGALMRDVRRYITGEAVHAVPPSTAYRLRKIIRRNKGPVAAGALLTLALVAGLIGTSLGFFNANQQRKAAEKEKTRADENASQARTAEGIATRQAYSANMSSASAAFDSVQYSTARAFLDAAPDRLRGWEWRVLDAKLDSSIRICTTGAIPIASPTCELILHPDGQSFFTIDGGGKTLAHRWDLESGRLLQSFPPPDRIEGFRLFRALLSPDGRRLTTVPFLQEKGAGSFAVDTWNLSTGERIGRVEIPYPPGAFVQMIASQDGSCVFVYLPDRVMKVRVAHEAASNVGANPASSELLIEQPIRRHTRPYAITHDGTVIAEAQLVSPYSVVLRDARSLAPISVLEMGRMVENVSFSVDDRWLGITRACSTALVYDLSKNPPTSITLQHPHQANNIRFSPDASLVATIAMDRAIRIWDRASATLLGTFASETLVPYPLLFMPDGKTVAGWESNGTIRFWDVSAHSAAVLRGHLSIVSRARFAVGNPAGLIVSSSWEGADGSTGIVRLWDADSGDEVGVYHGRVGDIVRAMDISEDGRYAAINISNNIAHTQALTTAMDEPIGRVEILDLTTGQRLLTSSSRRLPSWIAFGHDDRWVIDADIPPYAEQSVRLRLLDARSGAVIRTKELDPKPMWVFARHPEGRTIAVLPLTRAFTAVKADRPGTMLFLDTQTLEVVQEISGIPERQRSMAFSPDGTRIATGGDDGLLHVFDVNTGKLLAATSGKGMEVLAIAFSPDGTRLASGGMDRKVTIWAADTLDQVAVLHGHEGHIGNVDWDRAPAPAPGANEPSPNSSASHLATGPTRLVSCSGDNTVRVWEPVPIRTRIQAREARQQSLTRVEPLVSMLLSKLGDPALVAERVRSDQSLTSLDRRTALQVVLRKGLERHAALTKSERMPSAGGR